MLLTFCYREHADIQCDDSVSVTEPVTSLSLQNPFAEVSPDIDIGSNSLPHVYRYPNPHVSVCNSGMTYPLSGDQSVCGVYNAAGGQSDQTIYGTMKSYHTFVVLYIVAA